MPEQPTLYGHAAKSDISDSMTSVKKTEQRVYNYTIVLNGRTFDAYDMWITLQELEEGGIYITDALMVDALKKISVITSGGSRDFPATIGENFHMFKDLLKNRFNEL